MLANIRKLGRKTADRGATAVEYGLMVAAIAAIIVGLVFGIGTLIQGAFQDTCSRLETGQSANNGTGGGTTCATP
ncbi:Flp family type IVb pilin [Kineosporia sp. A_224]|uniref:Flp family type IVb pilin n=1 Tax=Kineosporia sp. A_224 TaxID=1962180 RepID=UPI000B4AD4E2|nr:Flp family type IVb pilin [Kineosporia sp. A_224]